MNLIIRIVLVLFIALRAEAYTNTTSGLFQTTGVESDVQAAITASVNGDTVMIPTGTNQYSVALNVTKAITLMGEGTNNTIIKDAVPATGSLTAQAVINVTGIAGYVTRITGIHFARGARSTATSSGTILLNGINNNGSYAVVDNCKFLSPSNRAHLFINGMVGVSHHNTHNWTVGRFAYDVRHDNWNGLSNADGSWSDSEHFGTDQFWFMEDNVMIASQPNVMEFVDTYSGGRWVARHNAISNSRIACHGTDSSGRSRGTRAIEFYNNTISSDNLSTPLLSMRSGVALVFSNTVSSYPTAFASSALQLSAYRMRGNIGFFTGAAGTNIWDNNDPVGVYESGTVTKTGTSSTRLFGDSTKSWTQGQWNGYTVRNLTTGRFAEVSTNGATNIFYALDIYVPTVAFTIGDSYEIRHVLNVIDQTGMGAGDVLNESSPAWPNQVISPCYEWSNAIGGSVNVSMAAADSVIKSGIHFFNDTPKPGYAAFTYPHPLSQAGISTVTIAALDASAGEPGSGFGTGSFVFTRNGDSSTNLVINFSLTGSTATSAVDYTSIGTTITILAGDTSATNTVTVLDDAFVESSETVVVTISSSAAYTTGSPSSATVTIFDDDAAAATVTVAALDATTGEPGSGLGSGSFVFTRTGPTTTNLVVKFSLTGSTATSGSDYTSIGTSIIIPSADSSVTNLITILDDALAEDTELIVVTVVTNFAAYLVAETNTAQITIADDEPHVSVGATDSFASEPLSGYGTGTFTFARTGSTAAPLTVNFSLIGSSTALSGVDFVSIGSSVTFGIGSASETKTVTVIDDPDYEGDETVSVAILDSSEYHVDGIASTVTIVDDDILPIVTLIGIPLFQ